jgi:hypothetical protein
MHLPVPGTVLKSDYSSSMNRNKPQLIASLVRASDGEVRHLLLLFIDGSSETNLVQLVRGIETPLEGGAEYETKQKASALLQLWAKEGFKDHLDGQLYERLEWTIPLALRLGHTVIYDSTFKQLDKLPFNAGVVSLAKWPGLTGKNGQAYEYALDGMYLHARPAPLPNSEPLVGPAGGKEFAAFMLEYINQRNAIGPSRDFLLGGSI